MDRDTWPGILTAMLAGSALVGVPGVILVVTIGG